MVTLFLLLSKKKAAMMSFLDNALSLQTLERYLKREAKRLPFWMNRKQSKVESLDLVFELENFVKLL